MVGKINLNDSRYKYGYKGFCSIINQVIDISLLHHKIHGNYNVDIEDPQILKFFDVLYKESYDEYYDTGTLFLNEFFNGNIDNSHNAHTTPNIDNLIIKNNTLNSILTLKDEILVNFEEVLKEKFDGEEYIGVQLRGTDKKNEISPVPDEKIIEGIDSILSETKLKRIFLATDDIKYVNLITERYGDHITINEGNIFSMDSKPIHFTENKEKINLDVLFDVYFLKNSSYICYTYSNVGYLAMIMGINNIKGFKILNEV